MAPVAELELGLVPVQALVLLWFQTLALGHAAVDNTVVENKVDKEDTVACCYFLPKLRHQLSMVVDWDLQPRFAVACFSNSDWKPDVLVAMVT